MDGVWHRGFLFKLEWAANQRFVLQQMSVDTLPPLLRVRWDVYITGSLSDVHKGERGEQNVFLNFLLLISSCFPKRRVQQSHENNKSLNPLPTLVSKLSLITTKWTN